jgi:6-phosphofructokinase
MAKYLGILTAGGDSPGLNAAIRAVGKASLGAYGMKLVGFRDGFRGIVHNRTVQLDDASLSDIITRGGTILGASRDKPHKMEVGNQVMDMTDVVVENYRRNHLDALICLGGGGTQKNALRLSQAGLNIITLPKTIDNDVAMTDTTFGFDSALEIATESIDRLHSTAHSHHRIIILEIMGHRTGWLALGSGLAGGADVILIPEIPYDTQFVAEAIRNRSKAGKRFSIIALSEGAFPREEYENMAAGNGWPPGSGSSGLTKQEIRDRMSSRTLGLSARLQELTGLESRVTILGHLQRGGAPTAADRILATRLGTACARLVKDGIYGVMVAAKGEEAVPVPLEDVAGKRKTVPLDHPWIQAALKVGTCLGAPIQ